MKAYDYQITDPWFARPIPQTRVQRPYDLETEDANEYYDRTKDEELFESQQEPEEDISDY